MNLHLLLPLALTFALAACSGEQGPKPADAAGSVTEARPEQEGAQAPPAPEPAPAEEPTDEAVADAAAEGADEAAAEAPAAEEAAAGAAEEPAKTEAAPAAASSGTPDIVWDHPMGKVTFSHTKHTAAASCDKCHPGLFAMKKGALKITMADMNAGKNCGSCHNGSAAFAAADCARCHVQ